MINQCILQYCYPPLCLHCNCLIERGGTLFCSECSLFFEFLKSDGPFLACFEYYGAVATFIKTLKSKKNPFLAKTAAAFLLIQFVQRELPLPDYVIPVPCRAFFTMNDHVRLMAHYFSRLLTLKKIQPIKRIGKRPRQITMSQEERKTLSPTDFFLKDRKLIQNKKILLIDDVMTTKSTLQALATLLLQGGAKEVSALVIAERGLML